MKKLSMSMKIVGLVVCAVIIVGLSLAACTYFFLGKTYDEESRAATDLLATLVMERFKDEENRLATAAKMTASRQDLAEAISKGDTAAVQRLGKDIMRDSKISLITIADKDGKVVGRGHSDKAGDSVLTQSNVRKALAGETNVGIEEGTVVKFSLRSGTPVKLDGQIVGSVTAGTDLTSAEHAFAEDIKRQFRVECSIFQGDTRASTTVVRDGKRALGTKMENAKVLDTVLAKGERYLDVNTVLGVKYDTAYWPIKDSAGKTAGMFSIGKERTLMAQMLKHSLLSISAVLFIIGFIMILAGTFIARSITRPVQHVIQGLTDSAEQFVSVSKQVSSASHSLAQGASEQAASIEETSSSLEEMSSMTKQNADNASTADNLMKQSRLMVDKANGSMTELTRSMEDISKASEETSKIIKTIDEIAFQTNLLALNAAVEAARAGEAGAGFAVVANEVRNLAMRAAEAAKNTANLIEGTVKRVKEGSELVERTNGAFSEVSKSAAKVDDLVSEIAAASGEQAQGIDQVNKAVSEMERVTQQSAANAEESAAAGEELTTQAEQLRRYVDDLDALIGGSASNGKDRGLQESSSPAGKPQLARAKSTAVGSLKKVLGRKAAKPDEVIPFDKGDFKDF